ncbi:asparagine synthase (glutamine-hydrolyzing) [Pedobacter insulae]|uniref:asparagine synthase (glutamine-hydrolyzing) n=1 Tax=Pedobacter insulae TaxID=414048 RepID=A0A1I2VL65_9SPHI|nr:asparagine synthase (glutamine-hydrolyzing) [Pedobacter insulae]SFG88216.1 asparagine synthase (glutamine-hydrolysing) [Pedobacter insulae]
MMTGFVDNTHTVNETNLLNGTIFEQNESYTIGFSYQQHTLPVTSACKLYTVTLNGSIYNDAALRETLIKYGVTFKTLTGAEVLIECYKKWGQSIFEKIDGSYSFVLHDRKLNQLLIARDTIGTKPLFYYKTRKFYAFASEIKALWAYPNIVKKINRQAISTYFKYGYFAGNDTIYQEIYQFKKGTITVIDLHSGNNYDAPILFMHGKNSEPVPANEEQIIDRVEELLTESILNRNTENISSGVLLSSGYDSATLASILQKNQSKRIKTFTIGFENKNFDEAPKAKKIAEHLRTNHTEFYFNEKHATTILESLPKIFDEPIGDNSVLPSLFIAENLQQEVKILLGTEGGDVLFGGYKAYTKALKLEALRHSVPYYLRPTFNFLLNYAPSKTKEAINADNLLGKYQSINTCFTDQEIERLLNHSNYYKVRVKKGEKTLKDLMDYDFENYLPNNLLYKGYKSLRYFGIDHRDAFLKADLINYLAQLDANWFIKKKEYKYLLRKITHKYVPAALMDDAKRDFTIPLPLWLKTCFKPYVETYLSVEQLNKHQLLNIDEVLRIKARFYANSNINNAKKIWLLLQFQLWYEQWG